MEGRNKIFVSFIVLVSLIIVLYFFTEWFSKTTGYIVGEDPDNALAKCLTKEGAKLYTTDSCPECKKQKSLFGTSSFKFIDKVDCSYERAACLNLQLLPAWFINDTVYYGVKSTDELRILSGCEDV